MNNDIKNIEETIKNLGINTTSYWKKQFMTLQKHQLGVVKASGKLLEEPHLTQLCSELAYIGDDAGFYLPLVIGGGVEYDRLCKDVRKVNGLRVTSKDLMERILEKSIANQIKVQSRLIACGTDAITMPSEIINVEPHGYEIDTNNEKVELGYVGNIVSINTKPIIEAIHDKKIPIIPHVGYHNGEYWNINATSVAKELVRYLGAKKLIIEGDMPVMDSSENIVKTITSMWKLSKMIKDGVITGGMVTNCLEVYDLLKYLGPGSAIHITKLTELSQNETGSNGRESTGLLEEILGDGSGTKIIMPSTISAYPLCAIDKSKVTDMINNAFSSNGKKLREDYFQSIESKDPTIYLDSMNACGAITYPIEGTEYMCKLFTIQDYGGLGIATSIIETIQQQKTKLVWRTSKDNISALSYYRNITLGFDLKSVESKKFQIFFLGFNKNDELGDIANKIINIPETFEAIK